MALDVTQTKTLSVAQELEIHMSLLCVYLWMNLLKNDKKYDYSFK